jgi:hypothetical protein
MFRLTIKTGNAAFADDMGGELGRIVHEVGALLLLGVGEGIVRDANGNTVGSWVIG